MSVMRISITLVALIIFYAVSAPAHAQNCKNPAGVAGGIVIGRLVPISDHTYYKRQGNRYQD